MSSTLDMIHVTHISNTLIR